MKQKCKIYVSHSFSHMSARCVVCRKHAQLGQSIQYQCGHYTHGDCTDDNPNFAKCPDCMGEIHEPTVDDGKDYVLTPGIRNDNRGGGGALGTLKALIGKKQQEQQTSCLSLLEASMPVMDLFRNGVGLQHLLREGASWDDFVGRYSWVKDMSQFEDVKKRPIQVLVALGFNANDLRDMRDEEDRKALLSIISPQMLANEFGLHFPPPCGSLCCVDDNVWNAEHCARLGLTMDHLITDMGMTYIEQYEDLMAGLTPKRAAEAEQKLEVTEKHLQSLNTLRTEEMVEEEEEQRKPTRSSPMEVPKQMSTRSPSQTSTRTPTRSSSNRRPVPQPITNLYKQRAEKTFSYHGLKE